MGEDRRLTFIRRWLKKARKSEDPFDRFFAAWIALVVAAQRTRDSLGRNVEDKTDRERVKYYFRCNEDRILRALHERKPEIEALSRRRGTARGNESWILETATYALYSANSLATIQKSLS